MKEDTFWDNVVPAVIISLAVLWVLALTGAVVAGIILLWRNFG